jgi:hypothetical protein
MRITTDITCLFADIGGVLLPLFAAVDSVNLRGTSL